MKKLLALLCTCAALSASAQDFKPFKFNISLGYARPTGPGAGGGILASIEPKYGLTDNFDVGLRAELAVMAKAVVVNGKDASGEVKGAGSYVLTGTYVVSSNSFRPYVGLGAGLYSVAGTSFTYDDNTQTSTPGVTVGAARKLGIMARIGFKAGHFNMGAEYNIVPSTKIDLLSGQSAESANSYIGVKLGFDIGGGRYK
jgi:outer membrane protein W